MTRTPRKALGALVLAAVAILATLTTNPSPTYAAGPTIELQHNRLQPDESTLLYPDTDCPNAAPGESLSRVWGTFTDADSQVFSMYIGNAAANGNWESGAFRAPFDAAFGVGSLTIYCSHSIYMPGYPNLTFDPVSVTVVGQTTGVTVDRLNVWHEAEFSSIVACDPNALVDIQVHSQDHGWVDGDVTNYVYGHEITDTIASDRSGMWSYSVDLNPNDGWFTPGMPHSFRAVCKNNSGDYEYGSYYFIVTKDQFVALGDSYSSGLGAGSYYGSGSCSRSFDSYPFFVSDEIESLDPPNHVACAGAVTDNLFSGFVSLPNAPYMSFGGQLSQLTDDTEVVTLTIGGNDAGFAEVLGRCAQHAHQTGYGCSSDSSFVNTVTARVHALAWRPSEHPGQSQPTVYTSGGKLIHSYVEVLEAIQNAAPNASIYVTGYPRLFGDDTANWTADTSAPGGYKCIVHSGFPTTVSIGYDDAMWMNGRVNAINGAIQAASVEVGPSVSYVPVSGFYGNGHCDSGIPFIKGVELDGFDPSPESFHPTITGMQLGYGVAFASKID